MPYGQTLIPGMNNPQGYQRTAEENLNLAGAGYQNPYTAQLGSMGQGLYGQYMRNVVPAMDRARSAALYRPDMVSRAAVDAQMTSDQARDTTARNMTRMGINPNSGRFAGLQTAVGLAGAANKAGAMTRAEHMERQAEFGNLLSAAGLGQQLAGQGLSAISGAGNAARASAAGLEGLAEKYGSLSSSQQQGEDMQKAEAANASQKRIDSLLQDMSGQNWYNSQGFGGSVEGKNQTYQRNMSGQSWGQGWGR